MEAVRPARTAKDLPWNIRYFLAVVFGGITGAAMGLMAGLASLFFS